MSLFLNELYIYINEVKKANGFAFADVNCRTCLKMDDEYHYFDILRNSPKTILLLIHLILFNFLLLS